MYNDQSQGPQGNAPLSTGLKWKYSFYSALAFFVVSSPQALELTNICLEWVGRLFGINSTRATSSGLLGGRSVWVSNGGMFVQSCVFMVVVFGLMKLPKDG